MVARRTKLRPLLLAVAGTLSIALVLPPATANGDVRARTVASGLNNPRGIFPRHWSFILRRRRRDRGRGPCQPGPFGTTCVGLTGAVTHVRDGISTGSGTFLRLHRRTARSRSGRMTSRMKEEATVRSSRRSAWAGRRVRERVRAGRETASPRSCGSLGAAHAGRRRPPGVRRRSQPRR